MICRFLLSHGLCFSVLALLSCDNLKFPHQILKYSLEKCCGVTDSAVLSPSVFSGISQLNYEYLMKISALPLHEHNLVWQTESGPTVLGHRINQKIFNVPLSKGNMHVRQVMPKPYAILSLTYIMIQFNLVPDCEPERSHVQLFVKSAFTGFNLSNVSISIVSNLFL